MNRILKAALTASSLAFGLASADELPNQVDLRAAYCASIVRTEIAVVLKDIARLQKDGIRTDPDRDDAKLAIAGLDAAQMNLRRLQMYLLPRVFNLEPFSLALAKKRGEEEAARALADADACMRSCLDRECTTKCGNHSEAIQRARGCRHLTSLPF